MKSQRLSTYIKSKTKDKLIAEAAFCLTKQFINLYLIPYSQSHRMLGRTFYLKESGRSDLVVYGVVWDITLSLWNGDWTSQPGPLFEELATQWGLLPLPQEDVLLIVGFDDQILEKKDNNIMLGTLFMDECDPGIETEVRKFMEKILLP